MKHILIAIFLLVSIAAYSQQGSLAQSGYFSRVQDSTAYVTAAATRHAAGYIDWWCSDSSNLCWVWDGSAYVNWVPSGAGGHTIEEEGTSLTARTKLNFVGAGVTVTDDSGDDASVVTIPSGSVIGAQDLYINAGAFSPRATNGSSTLTPYEMATSLVTVQSLDFDNTTQEYAQFGWSPPRNWNNGTVTVTVYWTGVSGTGTVQWDVSAVAYSNDDPMTGAFGTVVEIDDTLLATNDLHISPTSTAITVGGTPADADMVYIQVSRDPAEDTLSADAKFLGIRLTITLDASTSE